MFLTHGMRHLSKGFAPTSVVIRRKCLAGKIVTPELSRDDIHFLLDANEFRFGIRQHLIGRQSGVQDEFELL